MNRSSWKVVALLLALSCAGDAMAQEAAVAHADAASGEWPEYGNSLHGTRFSPLAQINPGNVDKLEKAWTYHTGPEPKQATIVGGLEVTPLMVDDTVYVCTAYNVLIALDPDTGKEKWRHDPGVNVAGVNHPVCRGVAFYRAPQPVADCPTRILSATVDNRLIAVDARTGMSCESFGDHGQIDLTAGLGKFDKGWGYPTSPPVIVNGIAAVGGFVIDNQSTDEPPGVIRGFDAVTGKFAWAFDPEHPDKHGQPGDGQHYAASSPNSWSVFSGDEKLGLIYVPMGNSTPDYFGGHRSPNTEKFSSAVVALDAKTGDVRWTFQTVHHDLWDYDVAAQPTLADIPTADGIVPGLIQPTKSGQLFVLDRRTGKPISRVVEKAAPKDDVPGEHASPTQPYSVDMPSFAGDMLTEKRMWGLTPFDQLYCRIKFHQARYEGEFTPMGMKPSIRSPGELGGIDWGGVSVNEDKHIVVINSNQMADWDQLLSREEANRRKIHPLNDPAGENAGGAAMAGTPFGVTWGPWLTPLHVPCQQPPYGFITAVDLNTKKILWQERLGSAYDSGPFGMKTFLPIPLGTPNIGGTLQTRSGLIFVSATQEQAIRAIDLATGKILWKDRLPAGGHATPMTYTSTKTGRQYVIIAAGGNLSMQTKPGDAIIAYALPN
jgi:quinoprotein glucose dehydrogenase